VSYIFILGTVGDTEAAIIELARILDRPATDYDVVFAVDCPFYYPQLPFFEINTPAEIKSAMAQFARFVQACKASADPDKYFGAHIHTVFS